MLFLIDCYKMAKFLIHHTKYCMKDEFEFVIGQRFISQTEQELGLGRVTEINHRMVKLVFEAANESRIYAKDNAPISRIIFAIGDTVPAKTGWNLTVSSIQPFNGLVIYQGQNDKGEDVLLPETEVADSIKLDRPSERLFSGHLDSNKWFNLRQLAIIKHNQLQQNYLYGLIGARTSLLAHQLYIAQEVAKRFAPRVLLADEVGLGKTIEAGLIIHQQLLKNRAKRILIIIPESLTHQWMVEMLRRFNLHFSVYNEQQCQAIEESSDFATPFESSQLAIVPLQFLLKNSLRAEQVLATQWDMLVVDEAHHLHWSQNDASSEYQLVEKLAAIIPSVLLLTATPEQLGKQSHFARLRLLDASRFSDFDDFEKQEQNYQGIVNAIDYLRSEKPLTKVGAKNTAKVFSNEEDLLTVQNLFEEKYQEDEKWQVKQQLIEKLLDQHGTGRILFRNTRSAIKGFPKRKLIDVALENCYADYSKHSIEQQLTPERIENFENWSKFDSRMTWLAEKILTLVGHKILLIARHKETILQMAETLRLKLGVHSAIFHEDLSLIERDKAAAWFADFDKGAQIMLCSEIGSEGRNFQFAHHLIFFDLPFNPDLLEQRIGRLDRIGQEKTIKIYVPYFADTAAEKLFKWYHLGLNLFTKTNPAAYAIFKQQKEQLQRFLTEEHSDEAFQEFIQTTQELSTSMNHDFQKGRDKLLEYNSCRPFVAAKILQDAIAQDDISCQRFMHRMFDRYGVEHEDIRRFVEFIKPSENLKAHFPGLIDDGMSVTFDRQTALSNETLHYLTWEHPMVTDAIDMIISEEKGNASLISLKNTGLKPSTIIIEALFSLHAPADTQLQLARYLPAEPIRLVADEKLINRTEQLSSLEIHNNHEPVALNIALQVVKLKKAEIKKIIDAIEKKADKILPEYSEKAQALVVQDLDNEINRLEALSKVNPNIRSSEIKHLKQQKQNTLKALADATLQMNALRLMVCL